MNDEMEVPKWYELLWPTLKALEALGGSARVRELEERLASELQLPDSVLDKLQKEGSARTAVSNNAAWSRTYLKKIGAVDNPSRGVWTITKNGRDILSEGDEEELHKQARNLILLADVKSTVKKHVGSMAHRTGSFRQTSRAGKKIFLMLCAV